MAIMQEARGSGETFSSSGGSHSWMPVSIGRKTKSEDSEDIGTFIHSDSLDNTNKKQAGSRILKKFLFNLTKGNKMALCDEEVLLQNEEVLVHKLQMNIPMGPATYLRPLQHKLEPRREQGLKGNAFSFDAAHAPGPSPPVVFRNSMYEIARNRAKAARILNGEKESNTEKVGLGTQGSEKSQAHSTQQGEKSEHELNEDEVNQIIRTLIYEHHEQVVAASAKSDGYFTAWREYLRCYRKGRFNLNKPPPPPPTHGNFSYLQATFPEHEVQRRSVCESLDTAWVQWPNAQAAGIITTVMNVFNTRFASISFFDHDNEIFKVENGYKQGGVSRTISIAAHALLSDDVLVVLDTQKDWRFANNPLVINEKPSIRFFAGAPMLSQDGHAVGVLAIFGREPRSSFSPHLRRQLADYASKALESLLGESDFLDRRSTPILQRDSVINGDYHSVTTKSPKLGKPDNDICQDTARSKRMKKPGNIKTKALHVAQQSRGYIEQTPPSTASDDGHQVSTLSGVFSKLYEEISSDSEGNIFPSLQDLIIPDVSRRFESPSPRPFSASDITSLNIQPANTPRNSLTERNKEGHTSDVTVAAFLALSDEDCSEEPDLKPAESDDPKLRSSPLIDLSTPHAQNSPINEQQSESSGTVRLPSPQTKAAARSTSSSQSSQVSKVIDLQAEAAFACRFLANSLGFDLIYAAEVIPKRPGMSDRELIAAGGIEKRILAAHGVVKTLDLSSPVHLDVLRTRGGFDYALNSKEYKDDEFEIGYLIPLHTELGALRLRSSGIVIGAYKKQGRADENSGMSRKMEADRLREAAEDLKPVFLKASRLQPKKSQAVPNSYPANEAVEVGHTFDSMQRAPLQVDVEHVRSLDLQDHQVPEGIRPDSRLNRYTPSEYSRPSSRAVRQDYNSPDYSQPGSRTARQECHPACAVLDSASAHGVSLQRQRY